MAYCATSIDIRASCKFLAVVHCTSWLLGQRVGQKSSEVTFFGQHIRKMPLPKPSHPRSAKAGYGGLSHVQSTASSPNPPVKASQVMVLPRPPRSQPQADEPGDPATEPSPALPALVDPPTLLCVAWPPEPFAGCEGAPPASAWPPLLATPRLSRTVPSNSQDESSLAEFERLQLVVKSRTKPSARGAFILPSLALTQRERAGINSSSRLFEAAATRS